MSKYSGTNIAIQKQMAENALKAQAKKNASKVWVQHTPAGGSPSGWQEFSDAGQANAAHPDLAPLIQRLQDARGARRPAGAPRPPANYPIAPACRR